MMKILASAIILLLALSNIDCIRKTSTYLFDYKVTNCPENGAILISPCRGDTIIAPIENCIQIIDQSYEEGYFKVIKLNNEVSFSIFCGLMMERPMIDSHEALLRFERKKAGSNTKMRSGVMKKDTLLSWREDEYDKFSIFYFNIPSDKKDTLDEIFDKIIIKS